MPGPVAVPIVLGAASLLKGLLGFWGAKKQADQLQKQREAERQAQIAKQIAEKMYWTANEDLRGARLDASQYAIGNVGKTLGKGAPSYLMDPAILERMKKRRPFPGSLPANPAVGDAGAGLGSSFLSGLAGGAQDVLLKILLGKLQSQGVDAGNGVPGEAIRFGEEEMARQKYCADYPTSPGCPQESILTPPNNSPGGRAL